MMMTVYYEPEIPEGKVNKAYCANERLGRCEARPLASSHSSVMD